jgi:uncharacterized protein (TIGR02594 family)
MASPYQSLASLNGTSLGDNGDMIRKYLRDGGVGLNPSEKAWCAAVVNSSLAQSGLKGTGSDMARSFMKWGQGTDNPNVGDIAVFSRGDPKGPFGHVGFFQGYDDEGNVKVLGGNQNKGVNVSTFPKDRLLGFRSVNATADASPVAPPEGGLLSSKFDAAPSPVGFTAPGGLLTPAVAMPANIDMGPQASLNTTPSAYASFTQAPVQQAVENYATSNAQNAQTKQFDFAGLASQGMKLMADSAPKQTWQPGAPAPIHRPQQLNFFQGLLG